jgi:hypothetical protein
LKNDKKIALTTINASPAAANIVFLKPARVTSQEGKSLKVSSVLRNEIQHFKSMLQKNKNRYASAFSTTSHRSTFGQIKHKNHFIKMHLFPNWEIFTFDKICQ